MKLIERIRTRGHRYFFEKAVAGVTHKPQAINYINARSIGILFNAFDPDNASIIKEYAQHLRNHGKNVEILVLYKNKKEVSANVIDHFTMDEVNWFHIPNDAVTDSFTEKPFDILLNLYTETSLPLEYLAALSKAKCRVGRYIKDKTVCFDLMVYLKEGATLKDMVLQVDHLLTEINKNATV